jgi:hypothetical protein
MENRRTAHRIDLFLHRAGILCFFAIFLILAAFLVGYAYEEVFGDIKLASEHPVTVLGYLPFLLKPWMFVCATGLPALGAALAGIRAHGDFEGSEQRSAMMVGSLTVLKSDFQASMRQESDLDETSERLIAASRVMSQDLAAWEELYGRKRLVLPG